MRAGILGMGWVTPLGTDLDGVYDRERAGDRGELKELTGAIPGRIHRGMPVPPDLVAAVGANPRLRRTSPITYFTATAGLAALHNAGLTITPELSERIALVSAVSSGSVIYTKKFFEQIVNSGAGAASPMLFPETVYNAPASHLSALLGLTGQTYTLVGDSAVGLAALDFSAQLLALGNVDYCLVVGGEELDWVVCEAYSRWRFRTIYSEGAGALLLAKEGPVSLETHPGVLFRDRVSAPEAIDSVCGAFANPKPSLIVGSGNETVFQRMEAAALSRWFGGVECRDPKRAFGESVGASTIQQVVYGAVAMKREALPNVLITALGYNEQACGARLTA